MNVELDMQRVSIEAKEAFDRLPNHLKSSVCQYLEHNTRHYLSTERDVVDAWLKWEGIIGWTDNIVELVLKSFGK